MKIITMDKVLTVTETFGKISKVATYKYKDLPKIIEGENEIEVNYIYGEAKRRENQLKKLGFEIKETIFFNNEAPYSRIKRIFIRK